ncbi:hypothetical protein KEM52_003114 [Ascosphaera acerosa]|nr:hypothetical protein KEM52_003114 [Ascosphaera acerosa]
MKYTHPAGYEHGNCPHPFYQLPPLPQASTKGFQYTKRHYLNVGAVFSSMLFDVSASSPVQSRQLCPVLLILCKLAFLFPLLGDTKKCYDEITPNDMKTSLSCAFSGAMIIFGGWAIVLWGLARSLLLHVQVCWGKDLEPRITTMTVVIAWFVPGFGLLGVLLASGVSYRIGKTCLPNAKNDSALMPPLLAVSGAAALLQFVTMLYSAYVYLRAAKQDGYVRNRSTLPSITTETQPSSAKQIWQEICKVFALQWRGIVNNISALSHVLFYAVIMWSLNRAWRAQESDPEHMHDWINCMIAQHGDKNACLKQAAKYLPSKQELLAFYAFLVSAGLCCVVFLFRWSIITGWYHMATRQLQAYPTDFLWQRRNKQCIQQSGYEETASTSFIAALTASTPTTLAPSESSSRPVLVKHETKDEHT